MVRLCKLNKAKRAVLGCSAYPECDYLRPLQRSEHKVLKTLDEICPKCGNLLQLKQGSFGMFIGCSHYPECDFVVREESETEEKLLVLNVKRVFDFSSWSPRKNFYGCDNFPKCKFSLPAKPYSVPCPRCHFPLSLLKVKMGKNKFSSVQIKLAVIFLSNKSKRVK